MLAFVNHSQFVLSNFWQKDCEIIYGLELLIAPLLRITTFSFLTSIFQSQTQVFFYKPKFKLYMTITFAYSCLFIFFININ